MGSNVGTYTRCNSEFRHQRGNFNGKYIRIKRSSGTNKPATLQWGELGYVTGIGSFGGTNHIKIEFSLEMTAQMLIQ